MRGCANYEVGRYAEYHCHRESEFVFFCFATIKIKVSVCALGTVARQSGLASKAMRHNVSFMLAGQPHVQNQLQILMNQHKMEASKRLATRLFFSSASVFSSIRSFTKLIGMHGSPSEDHSRPAGRRWLTLQVVADIFNRRRHIYTGLSDICSLVETS